uniref:Phosphatidate cytidylyltransferase, mitochondrial n=1 Tax=Caenorhabditis japonica TaxID=281687 RepID=A0A8R1HFM6_CAEJA
MDEYRELISVLPLDTIKYAFAYGSGPKMLAKIQTDFAARVYYNTHVTVKKRNIKYGVISFDDAKQDLLDWRWIYIAGRLHKPVLDVIKPEIKPQTTQKTTDGPNYSEIFDLVTENRRSALHSALLLLPESFSLKQLFHAIVGLSYTGDFRMIVGEDRSKIQKIVEGNYEHLLKVYQPLMNDDARLSVMTPAKVIQDGSTGAIYHRLNLLPSEVLNRIQKNMNRAQKRQRDAEEVIFSLSHRHDVAATVQTAIGSIIRPVSYRQTAKNAFSAGVTRSIVYSMAKMSKFLKSK